jgi:glycosyltransferase involved in cell wall biosynthesis
MTVEDADRVCENLQRAAPVRIAILDDLFPCPVSGFRFEEFSSYLDEMQGVAVYSNGQALPLVAETRPIEALIAEHVAANPRHLGRIHPFRPGQFPIAGAYYAIFLNNIVQHVEAIERTGKPFAFTLYPGGGFQIGDKLSDNKLQRVFGSPSFQRVIVTQPYTRDYLLKVHALPLSKIHYLQGGMVPRAAFVRPQQRRNFGISKASLDIGFVANRYIPTGEDKGYDLFVETADALSRKGVNATYHVVGPWDATLIPLGDLATRFVFYGFVDTEKLRELGQMLDLILSPNRPGILAKGAFDGFPTGSCVEVGLQEAAIFCTDVLKLNTDFRDGVDLVLVEPNVDNIVRRLWPVIQNPKSLAKIGRNGRRRLRRAFGRERQLLPRLAILRTMNTRQENKG